MQYQTTSTRRFGVLFMMINFALAGCATQSGSTAPIVEQKPKASKPETSTSQKANKPALKTGDWRPDTYTVKKGDTLLRISLELGYYYKEIAQANNIVAPYPIQVGQVLQLKSLKEKVTLAETNAINTEETSSDEVVITPINTEPAGSVITKPAATQVVTAPVIIVIAEPKALREVYSDEAFKKPLPVASKPVVENTTVAKADPATPVVITPKVTTTPETPTEQKPEVKTPESTGDLAWAWPTRGKVIANFNEGSNKGIDIAGSLGQPISAAAPGKVIYSGSDLRGYGKLVIIKHNANFLSVYAHNSAILVKEGQTIARGQKIAEMGNTDSNNVKLHFEIRQQGKSVDPNKYLQASM
jgi:lipoprotein NlpD